METYINILAKFPGFKLELQFVVSRDGSRGGSEVECEEERSGVRD